MPNDLRFLYVVCENFNQVNWNRQRLRDAREAELIVVDLRNNFGGSSEVLAKLLRDILSTFADSRTITAFAKEYKNTYSSRIKTEAEIYEMFLEMHDKDFSATMKEFNSRSKLPPSTALTKLFKVV